MTQTIEPPEHPDNTFAPTLEEIEAAWTMLMETPFASLHREHVRRMLHKAWLVQHGYEGKLG